MNLLASSWLTKSFPQNFLIRNAITGAMVVVLFAFGFAVLYKPLGAHAGRYGSYELTMAIYAVAGGIGIWLAINGLKRLNFFSGTWNVLKEGAAILFCLFGLGAAIYLIGFFMEDPTMRLNLPTFFDSIKRSFLIGIIPFAFSAFMSWRSITAGQWQIKVADTQAEAAAPAEDLIHISSQLKKEELGFYPGQFVYAASEGNYVMFYLLVEGKLKKVIIRNSISSIEEQLKHVPYFLRTHRAFIVNLKKVKARKGNALGYHLKLTGIEEEIPVSRNKTAAFNTAYKLLS